MAPTPTTQGTEVRRRFADPNVEPIAHDLNLEPKFGDRKVVGIRGKWYDITDFIDRHPGGPVIEHYIGQDATAVFQAYGHNEKLLTHRKVLGTYSQAGRHPADQDFEDLVEEMKRRGYFITDFVYYFKKALFVFALLAATFLITIYGQDYYGLYIAPIVMAFCFQQAAFIMHDCMHGQVFKNRLKDHTAGVFFGTCFFGISAHWWHDEHVIHHALTNTVDVVNRFVDPQMWEMSWAQNTKLFPLFKEKIHYYLIKIQHFTFVPVVVFIGRYEIVIDSFRQERRWYEWLGGAIHWMWMLTLLSYIPTWPQVFLFYFTAATVEGWFHFQLILSHYCKMFATIDEFHSSSWYIYQILSNMNILNPSWSDWYYGGLNFHIEHHLFPKMCRKYLKDAAVEVQKLCKKHNIDYDYCSFNDALVKTLVHLKQAGSHYKLDPR